jgi:hypothetical protein
VAERVAEVTAPDAQMLLLGRAERVAGGGKLRERMRLMGLQIPSGVIEIE